MPSSDPSEWFQVFGEVANKNDHDTRDVTRIYLPMKEYGHIVNLIHDGMFRGKNIALTHGKRRYCHDSGDEFIF